MLEAPLGFLDGAGGNDDAIHSDLVGTFSRFKEVHAIYVQRYREELQVTVLVESARFDDGLMDSLLDAEFDFRSRHPEQVFSFTYPLAGSADRRTTIHPAAKAVFVR